MVALVMPEKGSYTPSISSANKSSYHPWVQHKWSIHLLISITRREHNEFVHSKNDDEHQEQTKIAEFPQTKGILRRQFDSGHIRKLSAGSRTFIKCIKYFKTGRFSLISFCVGDSAPEASSTKGSQILKEENSGHWIQLNSSPSQIRKIKSRWY